MWSCQLSCQRCLRHSARSWQRRVWTSHRASSSSSRSLSSSAACFICSARSWLSTLALCSRVSTAKTSSVSNFASSCNIALSTQCSPTALTCCSSKPKCSKMFATCHTSQESLFCVGWSACTIRARAPRAPRCCSAASACASCCVCSTCMALHIARAISPIASFQEPLSPSEFAASLRGVSRQASRDCSWRPRCCSS